ncbi:MAG: GSCFA domain-containing protein [Bacteroidales bacterium]|nr:GSCFA domain-containing protein [Bacteroidales bacterium]
MIPLFTPADIAPSPIRIGYDMPLLLLGSCFTDEVGTRLGRAGFDLSCNPFGTLYNPLSIAACLQRAIDDSPIGEDELVCHDGLWHSWLHHGRFSHPDKEVCLSQCNDSISQTHALLQRNPILIITFGTAYVFRRQGLVVANCHKLPSVQFQRSRLSVEEIVCAWKPFLSQFSIIFTVSPIRHLADGAHGNRLSKSTLLLATDELLKDAPDAGYFDSYEILMDELRDYRFYARDLCHPSDVAVDIVWERFQQTFMTDSVRAQVAAHEKLFRQSQHRPIHQSIQPNNI